MFSHKKMMVEITHDDPVFHVIYLGNQMIEKAKQPESVLQTSWSLWRRNGRHCKKVSVTIGLNGINVNEKLDAYGNQHAVSYYYPIRDISYCMANKDIGGIFVWLESSGLRGETRCHAVACETPQIARTMARVLIDYCTVAHHEMVAQSRREERQKALEKRLVTERMRVDAKAPKKTKVPDDPKEEFDEEIDFGFDRNRPLKGGLVDKSSQEKTARRAKLKCIKIGSRKFVDIKMEDKCAGKLEVESNFNWQSEYSDPQSVNTPNGPQNGIP